MGVLDGGPRAPTGRGGSGGFLGPIGLNGIFLTEMFLTRAWKVDKNFHMDNISLEMTVYWLSENTVKFYIDVEFTRNMQKCNSHFDLLALQAAQTCVVDVTIAKTESLPGVCLFSAVWAILASLV